jgi:hypothetical protein
MDRKFAGIVTLYHFFFSIFEHEIKYGEEKVIRDNDSCQLYIELMSSPTEFEKRYILNMICVENIHYLINAKFLTCRKSSISYFRIIYFVFLNKIMHKIYIKHTFR